MYHIMGNLLKILLGNASSYFDKIWYPRNIES